MVILKGHTRCHQQRNDEESDAADQTSYPARTQIVINVKNSSWHSLNRIFAITDRCGLLKMVSALKMLFCISLMILTISVDARPDCKVKIEQGMPNRTICTVDTLEKDDPLKFNKQKNPDYLYIDVSYGEIPKDAFAKLKSHKELWFLGENITFIEPGAFRNMTDLDNLAITNTLITTLSANTFAGVPNLRALSLIKNRIEYIEEDAFRGLDHLQQLLLNENKLRKLNETTFKGLEGIQALYLDDNPIEYIHPNALRRMANLTRLVISFVKDKNISETALDFLNENQKIIHYL